MLPANDVFDIARLFYLLDINVRADLYNNRIADERDCVSRLVTHFNYPHGVFNQFQFNNIEFRARWFSDVNNGSLERKFGCDSMIVFKVANQLKVCLFEAKWPRVIRDPNFHWDSTQKSTKGSHFTSQILRQANWTNHAAIWELFFYEGKVDVFNRPFDRYGSTCVKHEFAKAMVDNESSLSVIWDNDDLHKLINSAQTHAFDGQNETNLPTMISEVLSCNYGKPIATKPEDSFFELTSNDGEQTVQCPIIKTEQGGEVEQLVNSFMKANGLAFFQQVDIQRANNDDLK